MDCDPGPRGDLRLRAGSYNPTNTPPSPTAFIHATNWGHTENDAGKSG